MKKVYIEPLTKYRSFEIETLLIGASEQDAWPDSKERWSDEDVTEPDADDKFSWGNLW